MVQDFSQVYYFEDAMPFIGAMGSSLFYVGFLDHAAVFFILFFDEGCGLVAASTDRKKSLRVEFDDDLRIAQSI